MHGVIVAAMPESEYFFPPDCFVIAADQGYLHLREKEIVPDLVLGDFDSLGFVPDVPELLRYPVEKDDSDMMLALREGLRRGIRSFLLYGGIGGRLDHTIANIQSLGFLQGEGANGLLYGGGTAVALLKNGCMRFPAYAKGTISVFSFGEKAVGVSETGLYYKADHVEITNAFPIGLSNSFVGSESAVSVERGSLLIVWQTDVRSAWDVFCANA